MSTPTLRPGPETSVWPELIAQAERLAAVPVRELFERDPGRFERFTHTRADCAWTFRGSAWMRSRSASCSSSPTWSACASASMPCGAVSTSIRRKTARCCTWRCASRAAPASAAPKSRTRCSPSARACSRSRRACAVVRSPVARGSRFASWSTSASGARTWAPRWRCRRCAPSRAAHHAASSCPTSTAATWPRFWRRPIRRPRCSSSASKTFTTLETLTNARSARAWLAGKLGEQAVPAHFAAVSVNHQAMDAFGVHPDYRFQMWDWVGGRYSVWSSIGVSLAIAVGEGNFLEFLRGGHEMDEHFRSTAVAGKPAGAHGAHGCLEHQLHAPADARGAPLR